MTNSNSNDAPLGVHIGGIQGTPSLKDAWTGTDQTITLWACNLTLHEIQDAHLRQPTIAEDHKEIASKRKGSLNTFKLHSPPTIAQKYLASK